MAKSSPEKLAQALRANLKRRKLTKSGAAPETGPKQAPKSPKTPEKIKH